MLKVILSGFTQINIALSLSLLSSFSFDFPLFVVWFSLHASLSSLCAAHAVY